ncbi:MAG TPA: phospholipase D-like domain-containing protein [Vicinamibacterales bacterium]|jgi:phosphatidylserine/phosphatidylglycerophosphate/cardiolipin synthase-like enzyme|nr:phospholipase D-like domain-containing protein [Vicinamibacterales bacterium]
MPRTLIVLPDDSPRSILRAVESASRTLRVKMFVFTDPRLLKAVVAAARRGVAVRVMLNAARRSGRQDNEATRAALRRAGVTVKDANPAFALTHEKSMVVDDAAALVGSLNWTHKNLAVTRDYAVMTTHRREVAEIVDCFEADWHRKTFEPPARSHLVWCPGPGRERICEFIDDAKHQLHVQNERYQDPVIIERLVRAARRGVKVHIMARPPHTLKREKLVEGVGGLRILDDLGVKVHRLKHLKLHGKAMVADGVAAIVGSINFAAGSLDNRRELAIDVRDDRLVDRLHRVVRHDWEHSHALDLSDEGLLADLEDRVDDGAELLGLDA